MKIIFLNGPPGSGKDTAAELLYHHYNVSWTIYMEKFSLPHKQALGAMLKIPLDARSNFLGGIDKEVPYEPLGVSLRQWQIDFSEKFMKPLYGEKIFGELFLHRLKHRLDTPKCLAIVSDCGFQVELDTVFSAIPDRRNILLLRMTRPGHNFVGDSREYVEPRGTLMSSVDIYNGGTLEFLNGRLLAATKPFLYPDWEKSDVGPN